MLPVFNTKTIHLACKSNSLAGLLTEFNKIAFHVIFCNRLFTVTFGSEERNDANDVAQIKSTLSSTQCVASVSALTSHAS